MGPWFSKEVTTWDKVVQSAQAVRDLTGRCCAANVSQACSYCVSSTFWKPYKVGVQNPRGGIWLQVSLSIDLGVAQKYYFLCEPWPGKACTLLRVGSNELNWNQRHKWVWGWWRWRLSLPHELFQMTKRDKSWPCERMRPFCLWLYYLLFSRYHLKSWEEKETPNLHGLCVL